MKKVFASLIAAALCAAATFPTLIPGGQMAHAAATIGQNEKARFVPDELLVKFKDGSSESDKLDARSRAGGILRKVVRSESARAENKGGIELLSLLSGYTVAEAIALLESHPAVEYAEPNWIYTHQATSNDPYYTNGSLWGMYGDQTSPANQYGSQAGEAWAGGNTGSADVYIGVIDEGIDINHPDLAANIWTNPFDPIDGLDNDGNGYVDDVNGYDFAGNNNSVYDGVPTNNDIDAHGTHVSGTIGGVGGNGIGVAGVNWTVKIISGKFLGTSGGTTADAIEAVNYFTDLKNRHGLNIVATNNSWGGGGFSQSLLDAITRGAKAGILFCAAAGNGNALGQGLNNDSTANYPSNYNTTQGTATESAASYDAVIAVASLTSSGARSSFSNYGRTTVDLGAPGSGVWSTTPNNSYSSFNGTSMATPHVTGAAALYKSINATADALSIKNAILDSARNTPTASLNNITVTNGRLNVSLFAPAGPPPEPPTAPTGLAATVASSSQINLSWTDNSTNEDGFKIERCQSAGCTSFAQIATVGANTTGYNNTGLSAGTSYGYRVRAYNVGGDSGYSNTAEATTQSAPTVPNAPSSLTATAGASGSRTINLSWADNSGNETGFKIERCRNATCTSFSQIATVGANTTSFSNTGLSAGKTYRYRVRAYNGVGDSAYSNIASAQTP